MPQELYALPCQRQGGTNAEVNSAGLAACAAILALAAPAGAITTERQTQRHPEVGALLAPQPTPTGPGRPARGR